jgi:hypothetical protein
MQFIGKSRSASLFSLAVPVMLPSTGFLTFDQGQKKAGFGDQPCEIAAGMAMKNGSNVFGVSPQQSKSVVAPAAALTCGCAGRPCKG